MRTAFLSLNVVTRRKLLELFNSLIGASGCWRTRISKLMLHCPGDISKCDELFDNGRRYYAVSFLTQDAAKWAHSLYACDYVDVDHRKALCMSGYNVDGVPLSVNSMFHAFTDSIYVPPELFLPHPLLLLIVHLNSRGPPTIDATCMCWGCHLT